MSIPAGWFPDEHIPGKDRYWDGDQWTTEIRDSVQPGPAPPTAYSEIPLDEAPREALVLTMTEAEFLDAIHHFLNRPLTHQALIAFHRVEKDLCYQAQKLADVTKKHQQAAHDQWVESAEATKAVQGVIWAFEQFYTTTYTPILNQLGEAMTADFNTLVKEMGGPTLLPVPFDQAWENYSRPVKALVERMDEERRPYLELVERIRNQYTS